MIEKRNMNVVIGAMNLLVVASPLLASEVSHVITADKKIEKLNATSLKSIESTWLQVPNACKARGFNASPVALENNKTRLHIQNIYASFGA